MEWNENDVAIAHNIHSHTHTHTHKKTRGSQMENTHINSEFQFEMDKMDGNGNKMTHKRKNKWMEWNDFAIALNNSINTNSWGRGF